MYIVDPFFHYHEPNLNQYYYELNNQRSQNDGIIKHFDYDAMLVGTSMCSGFKNTEIDELFECNSIKTTFSGAFYKEINDNIETALRVNPDLKLVIRGLDLSYCMRIDENRTDLGVYPTYLYNKNPLDDVHYLINRDILFGRVYPMIIGSKQGVTPGITSFDEYPGYMEGYSFGINTVVPDGVTVVETSDFSHLTDSDKEIIKKNLEQNVIRTADENPEVDFYYFFPPYSMAYWCQVYNQGEIYSWLEAEKYMAELIVPHHNIHLFSFFGRQDIITDLNNYKDSMHYASWICSLMLKWMKEENGRLTEDNYLEILEQDYRSLTEYDYALLNAQMDYEADYYAAAVVNKELSGADPLNVSEDFKNGIRRYYNLDDGYNYLCFNGQKLSGEGKSTISVYNNNNELLIKKEIEYTDSDFDKHQFVMDLTYYTGDVTIAVDNLDSEYDISEMTLY
ncbi:hypothetical protein SAMN02910371_03596 [Butyrivibrio sp. INlla14]|nr:hypothetical protein SAMN02910371_03596 [Butyrivibrio sp. INlla14]